jgi:hypothetical protein
MSHLTSEGRSLTKTELEDGRVCLTMTEGLDPRKGAKVISIFVSAEQYKRFVGQREKTEHPNLSGGGRFELTAYTVLLLSGGVYREVPVYVDARPTTRHVAHCASGTGFVRLYAHGDTSKTKTRWEPGNWTGEVPEQLKGLRK